MKKFAGLAIILLGTCFWQCGNKEGVCTGFSTTFNKTYCYDGWTESECKEYDDEQVNGAEWHFHEDQTCASRGL